MIKNLSVTLASFLFLLSPLFAEKEPGTIKVFNVQGSVSIIGTNGLSTPATTGLVFNQQNTILTGPNGSCSLIFSNGSSVSLNPNTRLNIAKFVQEPFDTANKGTYEQLVADPSDSDTDMSLEFGEINFEARDLLPTSTYQINTPAGAAGIRGTKGFVSYLEDTVKEAGVNPTENFTVKVIITEGQVGFTTKTGQPQSVGIGNTLFISGSIDPNGSLSFSTVTVRASTASEINQAGNTGVPSPTAPTPPPPPPAEGANIETIDNVEFAESPLPQTSLTAQVVDFAGECPCSIEDIDFCDCFNALSSSLQGVCTAQFPTITPDCGT